MSVVIDSFIVYSLIALSYVMGTLVTAKFFGWKDALIVSVLLALEEYFYFNVILTLGLGPLFSLLLNIAACILLVYLSGQVLGTVERAAKGLLSVLIVKTLVAVAGLGIIILVL